MRKCVKALKYDRRKNHSNFLAEKSEKSGTLIRN